MTSRAQWQEGNEQYLSACLAWLRLRLKHLDESAGNVELERAAQARTAAENIAPPPALVVLAESLGLSPFERDTLLLCVAMELDTGIATLCARAQDNPNRLYPTFALALALFDGPIWEAISPEYPLRYWRLIEIDQQGMQPLTTSRLRADERIVNYIKGLNHVDDRLAHLLTHVRPTGDSISGSQSLAVNVIVRHLEQPEPDHPLPVIQLLGTDKMSKQLVACRVSARLNLELYRMPAELLPGQTADLETLVRLWQRESILRPLALYLDVQDTDEKGPNETTPAPVSRFLERNEGFVFLDTRDTWPGVNLTSLTIDVGRPTPLEQRLAWSQLLADEAGDTPELLAGQFNLNLPMIERIIRTAKDEQPGERDSRRAEDMQGTLTLSPFHDRVWDACRAATRPKLEKLAQRLEAKATWKDIVLPEIQMNLLHQICMHVRQRNRVYEEWGFRQKMNRGFGISALFAGDSGTGKTMAAEVIANELRLDLYRIDLSAIVSKYIGETEKNLRRVFDAAEDGGAILFFDEADAIFGKRSEVKDSHDRYANIEVNYLLQRVEAFQGLAILATNLKSALDDAFLRRLRFIVNFPFPGVVERAAIWQRVFPDRTPGVVDLDTERLARLNLTGGSIHNVALNAAFLAAQAGGPITMTLVLDAAQTEFRKLELPINRADFR